MAADNNAATTLGMRIRQARERKFMSQEQLARAVHKSVRAVNDWENDRARPRSSMGALEMVLGDLSDPATRQEEVSIPDHIQRQIDEMTPEQQEKLIARLTRRRGDGTPGQAPA